MIATPYARLKRHFGELGTLAEVLALLHWDMDSIMPVGAAEARAEQIALIERQLHERAQAPQLSEWLATVDERTLDPLDLANLAEMRRRVLHATAVPAELVDELSRARSKSAMIWRRAREDDDFSLLAPYLERVIALTREQAEALGSALSCAPYDALLDGYDPGRRAKDVQVLFADLASFLPSFIEEALERQATGPAALPLTGSFPAEAQQRVARRVIEALGFDFARGRLDTSLHPFCGGYPDDVRITTRYQEQDVFFGLLGVIHETGHALYEQGLPVAWRRQPAGVARSMTIHESQSLLYEMQLGCSREFLEFLAPVLQQELDVRGPEWTPENLYRLATRVRRGLIRIEADEVTYPAHVLLRFELEQALLDGSLPVDELPGAWNDGMQRFVGVRPDSDRDGCLQDIHWPEGLFGYFPTYTLGAMTAAQLFRSAREALPGLTEGIARGSFQPLLGWLRQHVHQHASLRTGAELIEEATASPFSAAAFRAHLSARYLDRTEG